VFATALTLACVVWSPLCIYLWLAYEKCKIKPSLMFLQNLCYYIIWTSLLKFGFSCYLVTSFKNFQTMWHKDHYNKCHPLCGEISNVENLVAGDVWCHWCEITCWTPSRGLMLLLILVFAPPFNPNPSSTFLPSHI
jgi:hypothetical protein